MKRQIHRLTLLALLAALASPAAEAAETYLAYELKNVQITSIDVNAASPLVRPGTYNVQIRGERHARLIPVGKTATEDKHVKWIPLRSFHCPSDNRCSAEDFGQRGTFEAGRKRGDRQEVVFSMKGRRGCNLRGTFEVDLGK